MWKDFIRAFYSSWGSGVTGTASAPLFVIAFMANGVPRYISAAFAIVFLFVASYMVWAKERRYVIELRGRPEVSLRISRAGSQQIAEYLFGLLNASESTATNVTLSPISDRITNVLYEFDPIPSIVKGSAATYMDYHARTLAGTPIPPHNIDMVRVLGIGKALGTVQPYEIKLEFSNYGGESRWQVDYSLRFDFDAGVIACSPGACRKIL